MQLNSGKATDREALAPGQNPKPGVRDAVLIDRIRGGETALFYALVLPYQDRLLSRLLSVLRQRDDAKEVQQEVVLRAVMNLSRLRQKTKFRTWQFQIALNEARMRLRERRMQHWSPLEELTRTLESKCPSLGKLVDSSKPANGIVPYGR